MGHHLTKSIFKKFLSFYSWVEEWLCAGSQGHEDCLTKREMSHGYGFAWAAYITQQVPSFWRKSLLWRIDTTCLFTLDDICWHFLCAKTLISEQHRKGRHQVPGYAKMPKYQAALRQGTRKSIRPLVEVTYIHSDTGDRHVTHLSPQAVRLPEMSLRNLSSRVWNAWLWEAKGKKVLAFSKKTNKSECNGSGRNQMDSAEIFNIPPKRDAATKLPWYVLRLTMRNHKRGRWSFHLRTIWSLASAGIIWLNAKSQLLRYRQ